MTVIAVVWCLVVVMAVVFPFKIRTRRLFIKKPLVCSKKKIPGLETHLHLEPLFLSLSLIEPVKVTWWLMLDIVC